MDKEDNGNIGLINLFIKKDNQLHNTNNHMFVGVNEKDPTSTNSRMERFNKYIDEFNILQKEDSSLLDVGSLDKFQNTKYKIYGIVNSKKEVSYVSHSYLCLLKYASQIFPDIYDDWNIVCL